MVWTLRVYVNHMYIGVKRERLRFSAMWRADAGRVDRGSVYVGVRERDGQETAK